MQVAKLQLESKLRRNLASEIDKQKQIARNAEEVAKEKSKDECKGFDLLLEAKDLDLLKENQLEAVNTAILLRQ